MLYRPEVMAIEIENEPRAEKAKGIKRKNAFIIDDSESDQELFSSLPDTLEEFVPKPVAKKKEVQQIFTVETSEVEDDDDDDDDDFVDDGEIEDKKKKKPAKRTAKAKASATEAKKPKSEAIESTTEADGTTPKKKFK